VDEDHSKERYVLCLNSNKLGCFQEVDFHASRLLASVIGMVLTEANRHRNEPSWNAQKTSQL
jgi:hypothetical protein